jgi:hypothetical protein
MICRNALVVIAAICLALGCGTQGPTPPESIDPASGSNASSTDIVVSTIGVTIDGQLLSLPSPSSSIKDKLGDPSRIVERASTICVWDDLGIYCACRPQPEVAFAITVAFQEEKFGFSPHKLFSGRVLIDNSPSFIDKSTSKDALIMAGFAEDNSFGDLLRLHLGELRLNARIDDSGIVKCVEIVSYNR